MNKFKSYCITVMCSVVSIVPTSENYNLTGRYQNMIKELVKQVGKVEHKSRNSKVIGIQVYTEHISCFVTSFCTKNY